jgi:phosphatidylserine/phosphatidylglycerophosphate/cardiolipin synthase-like enzyme
VVDGKHVFVSSANFTEAARERNIEVGLLVQSRALAERSHNRDLAVLALSALGSHIADTILLNQFGYRAIAYHLPT